MKKKIIIGLSIFSLIFLLSSAYTIATIEHATTKMDNLIKLHQVEILREHLLIQIKRAQSDLYLVNTLCTECQHDRD
jgi:CHASE3 domain sensor protein